jgi:hypothetical protein
MLSRRQGSGIKAPLSEGSVFHEDVASFEVKERDENIVEVQAHSLNEEARREQPSTAPDGPLNAVLSTNTHADCLP